MRKLLWQPTKKQIESTRLWAFMQYAAKETGIGFVNYKSIYDWSVRCPETFWDLLWKFLEVKTSKPYDKVVDDLKKFPGAKWFVGAKLNYAENMLKYADTDKPALIFRGENTTRKVITYRELESQVKRLATALRNQGLKAGDAVAAYMPNLPETIIAMLAASAIGAVWCSCATDIGPQAAIDRLNPENMFESINKDMNGTVMPGWEPERMAKVKELFELYKDVDNEKLFL